MINNILKITERCSDISYLSRGRILVGMLFGAADLPGLKIEVISKFSSFSQVKMKNESWLGGGKYSNNVSYENGTSEKNLNIFKRI